MPTISYVPGIFEVLNYFYADLNKSGIYEEICGLVASKISALSGTPLSLSGIGFYPIRIISVWNGLINYEGYASTVDALAMIIIELCGVADNTLYGKRNVYANFRSRSSVMQNRVRRIGTEIDFGADKYFNIDKAQQAKCAEIPGYTSPLLKNFCLLVGCYLRRAPTIADLSGVNKLPVVVTERKIENIESLVEGLPRFIVDYVSIRLEADRNLMDTSINSRYLALEGYAADIIKTLPPEFVDVLQNSMRNTLLLRAYRHKPKTFDYERRYRWYLNVVLDLEEVFRDIYGYVAVLDSKTIKKDMMLTQNDYIHSIESYFEDTILESSGTTDSNVSKDIITSVNNIIFDWYKNKMQTKVIVSLHPVVCLLVYLSIFSTSRKRLSDHLESFTITIAGEETEINPRVLIRTISCLDRNINVVRIWARHYASLTLWVRKTNGICHNIWNTFYDVPQYLCFDTVNFASSELCDLKGKIAMSIISKWIRDCDRDVKGKFIHTLSENDAGLKN